LTIPAGIKNKRIGVLYGGSSEEKEISRRTGLAVLNALCRLNLNAVGIEVDTSLVKKLHNQKIDFCFLALHGRYGEDGTVQGLCEMIGIPYSGSGVLASALSMNKALSKIIFQAQGIPTAPFCLVPSGSSLNIKLPFSYPVVVKPVDSGSAIGVSIVKDRSQIAGAIQEVYKYSKSALIEKFIPGMELTVPILGEEVLPLIEIVPKGSFYDFNSKYVKGQSEHRIPARVSKQVKDLVSRYALLAHKALGCRACSRTDFILDKKGKPWILELNSIPGMTETSLYPESAAMAGWKFPELILEIIKLSQ